MSITLPDGQTTDLTAPESGLATLTLKDGISETPTSSHPSRQLGAVELQTGGSAVSSKTSPAFTVAVTTVSEPTS